MNERIRELAEQAGAKFPFGGFVNYDQFDCEKFAELIIQECADLCESFGESGDGYTCGAEILEHFKVEE